jgi:hypothetical protein
MNNPITNMGYASLTGIEVLGIKYRQRAEYKAMGNMTHMCKIWSILYVTW